MAEKEPKRVDPWRTAEMVVPFVLYLVVIVAGLAAFVVVGLTHH